MKLFIDNAEAETGADTQVSISLEATQYTDLDKTAPGPTTRVRIPLTAANRALTGDADQILAKTPFNAAEHTARIEQQGATVAQGEAMLVECTKGGSSADACTLGIVPAANSWIAHARNRSIRSLPLEFDATLNSLTIKNSWTWDKPVRFLPVQRSKVFADNYTGNLFAPARMLTAEDYHPFISCKALLESILSDAGYTLRSQFAESPLFASLHLSGNYPTRDIAPLRSQMDFLAGRYADCTATADAYGRVFADPIAAAYTVGNIVDTADAAKAQDGVTIPDVYNNGGCFRTIGKRIAFVPPAEVSVGFEYRLKYTTDYCIASRTRLKCFDTVHLTWGGEQAVCQVANRYHDNREEGYYEAYMSYRLIVFEHQEGDTYQFRHDVVTSGASVETTVSTFSTRTASILSQTAQTIANPKLYIKKSGSGSYVPYTGDWALYNGYVNERGTIAVELNVRSAPERILPSQPRYFDVIAFEGAEPGAKLTISNLTRLKPVFYPHPGQGSTVTFGTVAVHDFSRLDFVRSLAQMFNLHFATDNIRREVVVEPRDSFYTAGVVDWRDRLDTDREITVSGPGGGVARNTTLAYRNNDGAVKLRNAEQGDTLGRYTFHILNRHTGREESLIENAVFNPSINLTKVYPDAPAASFLQVGARDEDNNLPAENLNFPPKVVQYHGLKALPQPQVWGWPSFRAQYPLAAFHLAEESTLCFEDRDGVVGLHSYYDAEIRAADHARQITAHVFLQPGEVETLSSPTAENGGFRARYLLRIDGEDISCRLLTVEGYEPGAGKSTKCTFIQEV